MRQNALQYRGYLAAFAAAFLAAGLSGAPAGARDYTRSCQAVLVVSPAEAGREEVVIGFRGQATVPAYFQVNEARRMAHDFIIRCVREHWANRDAPEPPVSCRSSMDLFPGTERMPGYPFTRLSADLRAALCAANPDALAMTTEVTLEIRGNTGCVPPRYAHGVDPMDFVVLDSAWRVHCAELPGEGGAFERAEPPIGEGGAFEPAGEAPGGEPAEEPGEEPGEAPPASASYQLLPMIRLPGNDLRLIEMGSPNWMLCRQACTDEPACGAWTYRAPNAHSGPLCLLKRRAGMRIPDPCCQSGIKR